MLLCKHIVIKIVFSILFLSWTGNDNKSIHAEHGFVRSCATNNNIVSDVIQGQTSIIDLSKICSNTSKNCFSTLKRNKASIELYNLTKEERKKDLLAERQNVRLFGKLFFGVLFLKNNLKKNYFSLLFSSIKKEAQTRMTFYSLFLQLTAN